MLLLSGLVSFLICVCPISLRVQKYLHHTLLYLTYSRTSIIRNVNHPKRQISEPTFSSFYVQRTKNQRLLHTIKYCVISIKYCILYVLCCIVMVTLS